MTTEKIAITVPREVLLAARRAVRAGRAPSLSAYISTALSQQTARDDLEALLDEMLRESGGPLTGAELRDAERALRLGAPARRPR
jgi:Arc/MetJ-type ribon-helix-helix transcriptional regulator